MEKKDILGLESRRRIYHYISKYPGLHLRNLFRLLNFSEGTIKYHLTRMNQRGLISKKIDGKYTRFYVTHNLGKTEKEILSLLRRETPRNIILCLLVQAVGSQTELSRDLEKDPKTIEYHLRQLLDRDVIESAPVDTEGTYTGWKKTVIAERFPVGKEIIFRLKDPYYIYDVLTTYKGRLLDGGYTNAILKYFESTFSDNPPNRLKGVNSTVDKAFKMVVDIFPHPYYG